MYLSNCIIYTFTAIHKLQDEMNEHRFNIYSSSMHNGIYHITVYTYGNLEYQQPAAEGQ